MDTPSATNMLMPTKQGSRHAASSTAADETSAQRSSACRQDSLLNGTQGMDSMCGELQGHVCRETCQT